MRIPIVGTRHSKDNYSFENLTNKIMVGRSAEGVEPLVVVLDSDTANEALNKLHQIHGISPPRHDDSQSEGARSGTVLYATVTGEVPHDQTLADAFNVGGVSLSLSSFNISTSLGEIKLQFLPSSAPQTTEHIANIIRSGLYDNACFYRSDFVIQLGLTSAADGQPIGNPHADLANNETHANAFTSNVRGTMSVAHFDVPDNGNSEIFINLQPNVHLDEAYGGYCVFAQIMEDDSTSFNTVDAIAQSIAAKEGSIVPIESVRLC